MCLCKIRDVLPACLSLLLLLLLWESSGRTRDSRGCCREPSPQQAAPRIWHQEGAKPVTSTLRILPPFPSHPSLNRADALLLQCRNRSSNGSWETGGFLYSKKTPAYVQPELHVIPHPTAAFSYSDTPKPQRSPHLFFPQGIHFAAAKLSLLAPPGHLDLALIRKPPV